MKSCSVTMEICRAGTPLLWSQAERARAVQPGHEKAPGRHWSPFHHLKGLCESWRGTLDKGLEEQDKGEWP